MHIKGLVNVISGLFILLALTSCGVQNTESTTKVDDRLNVIYIKIKTHSKSITRQQKCYSNIFFNIILSSSFNIDITP